jgi:cell division protein FtsL
MAVIGEINFLFYVMFWTILAMMLVLLISLKLVMRTQRHIENIDMNIAKMVKKTLADEERIIEDIEGNQRKKR